MSNMPKDVSASMDFEFVFRDEIRRLDTRPGFVLAQEISTDVTDRLPGDLARFDDRYLRLAKRSQAQFARDMAHLAMHHHKAYIDLGHAFDERISLFPEIQKTEQRDVLGPLVGRTALAYVGLLTRNLFFPARFNRHKFLLDNGSKVAAREYVRSLWTPQYVDEVIAAHELGLTKGFSETTDTVETPEL